jgi:hypothetical protein
MVKKNITFRIDETLIEKLNELRGNRSQNAVLEDLLSIWDGISTSTSTSNDQQLQVQLLAQAKVLEQLQSQVQLLVNQSQVQEEPKPKPKKEKKKPEPTPEPVFDPKPEFKEEDYFLLKKPCYEGKPEPQHTRKTNFTVEWWLEAGDRQCFDENQNIIPFRYKKADGTMYTPTPGEIKIIEEAYEKPVVVE